MEKFLQTRLPEMWQWTRKLSDWDLQHEVKRAATRRAKHIWDWRDEVIFMEYARRKKCDSHALKKLNGLLAAGAKKPSSEPH